MLLLKERRNHANYGNYSCNTILIIIPWVKLTDTSLEFVMGFTAANSHFQDYENPLFDNL
jgi:hypothetical protein